MLVLEAKRLPEKHGASSPCPSGANVIRGGLKRWASVQISNEKVTINDIDDRSTIEVGPVVVTEEEWMVPNKEGKLCHVLL